MIAGTKDLEVVSTMHAKALGHDCAWCVGGTVRRPVWLEQSEQQGEREEGMGQVVPSLVGLWGGLGVLCKGH